MGYAVNDEQILDLGRRWVDAELQGDVDLLNTLLANDFVGIGPRGFVLTREQWLDRYRTGGLKNNALSGQDITLRVYGEAAVAVGIQTHDASYQGHAASGRFRLT